MVDPYGLWNLIGGVGGSLTALSGIEGSVAIVINPGSLLGSDKADIGVTGSVGVAGGVNVSSDIFAGITRGNIEDMRGLTVNLNIVAGPLSFTFMFDPETNQLVGGTLGNYRDTLLNY